MGGRMAHQSHPAQPAWAGKEVGPVGPEAVVHTAKVVQEFLAKKKDQTALIPHLFIWPRPSRLLPLPQAEEGAVRHHHDPGEVQEGVGGGPEGNQQGRVREGLRALERVVRKVYSHRRKLCLEIVKNNFPSNYHCLLFINTFRYHLDFTSYDR